METENNKSEEKLRLLISMGSEGIKMLAILAAELIGGIIWLIVSAVFMIQTGGFILYLLATTTKATGLYKWVPAHILESNLCSATLALGALGAMLLIDACLLLGGKQILLKMNSFLKEKVDNIDKIDKQYRVLKHS